MGWFMQQGGLRGLSGFAGAVIVFCNSAKEARITSRIQNIAPGLVGEVRRTVAGARHYIDHQHTELEFDLVLKGSGSFTLGERNYALKPGILIWLVPGQHHHLVRSPGLEMWVASLRPELIEADRIAQLAEKPLRQLPSNELIDLDRLLSQVAQDSDEPAVYNAGIAYLAMRAWRASLDSPAARARPLHPAVGRALMLLRESGAAHSLSELAKEAGVAAPYLSRLLIEQTGRSFVDWRNRIRIDRFMQGYRPGANLLDAALEAGFGSYARFNHIFNEMIGCAPSEWVKQADGKGPTPKVSDSYGVPAAPTLSTRQSWTSVLPLIAPSVTTLLGRDFIKRLVSAKIGTHDPAQHRFEPLDPSLPKSERERLIIALRRQDEASAQALARLIELNDFVGIYQRLLELFGLAPDRLVDGIAALVTALGVAVDPATEPSPADVYAVRQQVQAALGRTLVKLDRPTAQEVQTALVCHFVVSYRAIEAARASGDPREFDQLRDAASRASREAFGDDVARIGLTSRGFVFRSTAQSSRRRRTKR